LSLPLPSIFSPPEPLTVEFFNTPSYGCKKIKHSSSPLLIKIFIALKKNIYNITYQYPRKINMTKKSKLVEIKTKPTSANVEDFINSIPDEQKRKDSFYLLEMFKKITGEEPVLWSNSIIGFGNKIYKSEKTGREVDWLKTGFSPRKANLSLYISVNIKEHEDAVKNLGKHKTGVGCLYINKLEDINLKILENMIQTSSQKS
jgi:hypothetical protein